MHNRVQFWSIRSVSRNAKWSMAKVSPFSFFFFFLAFPSSLFFVLFFPKQHLNWTMSILNIYYGVCLNYFFTGNTLRSSSKNSFYYSNQWLVEYRNIQSTDTLINRVGGKSIHKAYNYLLLSRTSSEKHFNTAWDNCHTTQPLSWVFSVLIQYFQGSK